jgi:hypothetical protein
MGNLVPGAKYIYERVGKTIYARVEGADPSTRFEVGYEYDPISGHKINYDNRTSDGLPLFEKIKEDQLWGEIRGAAKTNPTIQEALERAKIDYYLSKEYEQRHGRKT